MSKSRIERDCGKQRNNRKDNLVARNKDNMINQIHRITNQKNSNKKYAIDRIHGSCYLMLQFDKIPVPDQTFKNKAVKLHVSLTFINNLHIA